MFAVWQAPFVFLHDRIVEEFEKAKDITAVAVLDLLGRRHHHIAPKYRDAWLFSVFVNFQNGPKGKVLLALWACELLLRLRLSGRFRHATTGHVLIQVSGRPWTAKLLLAGGALLGWLLHMGFRRMNSLTHEEGGIYLFQVNPIFLKLSI